MHYKFKAMQKMLAAVGISNDFSQRPVFQKIKEVTSIIEPSSEEISIIHNEIKNIEVILASTEKEEKNSVSSKKLKAIMSPINRQIIEAMNIYLSAWRMVAELHNIKSEDETTSEEKLEIQTTSEEKLEIQAPSEEKSEIQTTSEEKSEIQADSEEKSEIQADSEEKSEIQATSEEKSEIQATSEEKSEKNFEEEKYELDRNEISENIITLAEKAEQMLCEIEKKITDVLGDNPLEG